MKFCSSVLSKPHLHLATIKTHAFIYFTERGRKYGTYAYRRICKVHIFVLCHTYFQSSSHSLQRKLWFFQKKLMLRIVDLDSGVKIRLYKLCCKYTNYYSSWITSMHVHCSYYIFCSNSYLRAYICSWYIHLETCTFHCYRSHTLKSKKLRIQRFHRFRISS